jgi:hypothetical protein
VLAARKGPHGKGRTERPHDVISTGRDARPEQIPSPVVGRSVDDAIALFGTDVRLWNGIRQA